MGRSCRHREADGRRGNRSSHGTAYCYGVAGSASGLVVDVGFAADDRALLHRNRGVGTAGFCGMRVGAI
jgi:hypothetical protein